MKNKISAFYKIVLIAILALALTACNADGPDQEEGAPPNQTEPGSPEPDNNDDNDKGNNDVTNEGANEDDKTDPDTATGELVEQKEITFEIEGMTEKEMGTLFKSAQDYYIYALPNFTATGEEPGSDVIYFELDDRHWMRIQKLAEGSDFDDVKQTAREELEDIGEVTEEKDFNDPYFKDGVSYLHAANNEVTKVIILKEIDDQLFRFSIFIGPIETTEGLIPRFLAMIKTTGNLAE